MIAEIRRALGDAAEGARYIRTLHRYGYALMAHVTREHSAPIGGKALAGPRLRLAWKGGVAHLPPGGHVIGRLPDAAIRLDHSGVSRHHAQVTVADGRATLEDLGSRNGTYINRRRITGAVPLQDGDRITIGPVELACEDVQGTTVSVEISDKGSDE